MHILVTGASGFIGSHLCETLLRDGNYVTGIDNYDPYYDVQIKQSNTRLLSKYDEFRFIQGDILDNDILGAAIEPHKPEVIIHLAARPGVRPSLENPSEYVRINTQGTVNILDFARRNNIRRVMFASSSSVYGNREDVAFSEDDTLNPVSPYAASKASCEVFGRTFAQLYDMDITALRFFTVYGERGRPDMAPFIFTDAVLNKKPLTRFGTGETKRDYTHVSDVARGILAATKANLPGFQVFNLGNNSPVSLNDFIATIENACGEEAVINQQGKFLGDVNFTCANIDKAHGAFGYAPAVSLEDGIRRLVNWYREEYAAQQGHNQ
jgi:UDP-glucuronate 4-epimerase